MRTNLEIAAELIAADVRNLNNIEEYCGEPDFTEQDAIDRAILSSIVGDLWRYSIGDKNASRESGRIVNSP